MNGAGLTLGSVARSGACGGGRIMYRVGLFLVIKFLLFRDKISEFRINCFKFTQYFAVNFLIIIIIREPFIT